MPAPTRSPGWSIAGGLLLFVLAAPLIYWLFYNSQPSQWRGTEGEAAFKTWFWVSFGAHMLATFGGSAVLARAIHAPVLATVLVVLLVVALLVWPLLWSLSFQNACTTPWAFPLKLSC